jgi:uncharacterized protein YqhQ
MMRGVSSWAVALRTPLDSELAGGGLDARKGAHGPIEVRRFPLDPALRRHRLLRLPVVRGVVALAESLRIGGRALRLAVDAQQPADGPEVSRGQWALAVVLGILLAVVLFFLVPVGLTSLVKDELGSGWLFWLVEGVLRTAIFVAYLVAVTRQRDLRRLFEYHGAEHKVIAAHEAGLPLTPEHAGAMPRLHPRCGTSFLLLVMLVSVVVFAPIGLPEWYLLMATRVVGIPVVAGVAFELIKATGRHRDAAWARAVMWPGMQLQRLTTREPDREQLLVAIAALEAVLEEQGTHRRGEDLVGLEVAA